MRRRDPALLRLLHFEFDECVLCGNTELLHLHHVLLRSRLGDDVRANLVMLCRGCHDGYHRGNKRRELADHLTMRRPDTIAYLRTKLGDGGVEHWLEAHRE